MGIRDDGLAAMVPGLSRRAGERLTEAFGGLSTAMGIAILLVHVMLVSPSNSGLSLAA